MPKLDGGPAFPYQQDHILYHDDDRTKPAQTIRGVWSGGMTLRDYFAAQALSQTMKFAFDVGDKTPKRAAQAAYEVADALLAEREK